ncbi:hypothetical protein C8J57DRAFT_1622555 [Mycena rebaudengoi]|nr:hypothetical protein C8J57DRAFT_1622555 [Mycena rebaudengoi]
MPALLPATTFTTSCARSERHRPFPSPSPLSLPPRAPSASPASTILPVPHARRAHPQHGPHRSTCGSRSALPVPRLSPPRPPPPCLAPHYFARSQFLSGTGSTTPSIAGARSKCNKRSPSPTPPSSPPRAPRPSSAPTPPSAPNLILLRTANAMCTAPGVLLCGRPPHHPIRSPLPLSILSAIPPRWLTTPPHRRPCAAVRRLPITSAGCVCRDDTATGEQRTNDTETMRTPRFHQYPHSALGISDNRGWGTATILGAPNPGRDRGTYAAPGFLYMRISGKRCEFGEGYCMNAEVSRFLLHRLYFYFVA